MLKKIVFPLLIFGFLASGTGLYAQEQGVQSPVLSFLTKVDAGLKRMPLVRVVGFLTVAVAVSVIKKMWDDYIESMNPVDIKDKKLALAISEG